MCFYVKICIYLKVRALYIITVMSQPGFNPQTLGFVTLTNTAGKITISNNYMPQKCICNNYQWFTESISQFHDHKCVELHAACHQFDKRKIWQHKSN